MDFADKLLDVVFPVVIMERPSNHEIKFKELIGTCFSIGNEGFAVTAGHVIDQMGADNIIKGNVGILRQENSKFIFSTILECEQHPSQDVGLLKITDTKHQSYLVISSTFENSTLEYDMWAYPDEISEFAKEEITFNKNGEPIGTSGMARPELIFFSGYVRRRISRQFPYFHFKGDAYYELSTLGGSCCSGAPIIKKNSRGLPRYSVFGVYVGETTQGVALRASYAIRSDSFHDWKPSMLTGRKISELNI